MSYTSNSQAPTGYSSYDQPSPTFVSHDQSAYCRPSSPSRFSNNHSQLSDRSDTAQQNSTRSNQGRYEGFHFLGHREARISTNDSHDEGSEGHSNGSSIGDYTAQYSPTPSDAGHSQGESYSSNAWSCKSPRWDCEINKPLTPSRYASSPRYPSCAPSTGYSRPPSPPPYCKSAYSEETGAGYRPQEDGSTAAIPTGIVGDMTRRWEPGE